jgi:hypothetical protein
MPGQGQSQSFEFQNILSDLFHTSTYRIAVVSFNVLIAGFNLVFERTSRRVTSRPAAASRHLAAVPRVGTDTDWRPVVRVRRAIRPPPGTRPASTQAIAGEKHIATETETATAGRAAP